MSTQDIAQGIANVAMDPCLATVAQQLNKLHELEASSAVPGMPTQASLGIGLCKAVGPLQFVVWARENPIMALGLFGLVFGGIFGAGYKFAKRKAKSSTPVAGHR